MFKWATEFKIDNYNAFTIVLGSTINLFPFSKFFFFFQHSRLTPSEKAVAPHSSTLAWGIPWTEEPGRLQFMGSLRIGHD